MIKINLMKGDCLERMKEIPDKSVDMVLTDPPYGTTACKWDSVIPFKEMWQELKRIVKNERSATVLFGIEPFSSTLRSSNINQFKYDWIWHKSRFANQMLAKRQPLKTHEIISVFGQSSPFYYPQGLTVLNKNTKQGSRVTDNNGGGIRNTEYFQEFTNYPRSILEFKSEGKTVHSTQKPVALLEYLIKTYTLENETVLDFTMGSGSTGVACKNLNRNFIGIERDDKYFEIAKQRIENA
jgi:DNA modification methylase